MSLVLTILRSLPAGPHARRLQIVVKGALRNFVISIGQTRSLCSHIMDESHGELFEKAYHARLYIAFCNGTLLQAT